MTALLDLHAVQRHRYWAGQRHGSIQLLADVGLIAAQWGEGGGCCWAPTEAGRRTLLGAPGLVCTLVLAARLGPAEPPAWFERAALDHSNDLREAI